MPLPRRLCAVRAVAGLLALDLLAAGGALLLGVGRATSATSEALPTRTLVAGSAAHDEQETRTNEVRRLLNRRATAVLRHDELGFLASVDPAESAFYTKQEALFRHLSAVPLASWTYDLNPTVDDGLSADVRARYAAPTWVPSVVLRYRIRGFDPSPALLRQEFTFVHRAAGWLIGNDADAAGAGLRTSRELWDYGPVTLTYGRRTLVLAHPDSAGLAAVVAAEADAAVATVDGIWGLDWPQRVVLELPANQAELALLIDDGGDLTQIAAVAISQRSAGVGRAGVTAGDRVLVNPSNFNRLSKLGRRVVLTHEITHVATRRVTNVQVPKWLVEGFADFVGYSGTGADVRDAAANLAADVRAGRIPPTLPTDADFDGSNAGLTQAYEGSWMACRLIAARVGTAGLVAFYRAVGEGSGNAPAVLARALDSTVHLQLAAFTRLWQQALRDQLGTPTPVGAT